MRDRCPQHGIALADDGKCVLCRRTSRPTTAELYGGSRDRGGPPALLVGLASVLAVAAVAAAIFVVTRSSIKPVSVTAEPGARGTSSSAASAPGVEPSPSPPSASSTESAEAPTGAPVASVRWVSEPLPEEAQARGAAAADVERARLLERQQQAEFEAWAHREANREIEEQEARARRSRGESQPAGQGERATRADMFRGIPITMYSASWCGACSAARAFLQGAQIPFTERDVDTDPSAALEARRLNPRGSIPTIDVAGTTIVGFRPNAILAAIENAARRR